MPFLIVGAKKMLHIADVAMHSHSWFIGVIKSSVCAVRLIFRKDGVI